MQQVKDGLPPLPTTISESFIKQAKLMFKLMPLVEFQEISK